MFCCIIHVHRIPWRAEAVCPDLGNPELLQCLNTKSHVSARLWWAVGLITCSMNTAAHLKCKRNFIRNEDLFLEVQTSWFYLMTFSRLEGQILNLFSQEALQIPVNIIPTLLRVRRIELLCWKNLRDKIVLNTRLTLTFYLCVCEQCTSNFPKWQVVSAFMNDTQHGIYVKRIKCILSPSLDIKKVRTLL